MRLNFTLSFDEANTLLDQFVTEKGADYVYPGAGFACVYFERDYSDSPPLTLDHTIVPSCIVGHVLAAKGVEYSDLEREGTESNNVAGVLHEQADSKTKTLLAWAQEYQDEGVPWGRAVAKAREDVERGHHHNSVR